MVKNTLLGLLPGLIIEAPIELVSSLSNKKMREKILDSAKQDGNFYLFSCEVLAEIDSFEPQKIRDNKLVFIKEENQLQFICSVLSCWSNELLPLLISPLITDVELNGLIERFKPFGVISNGDITCTNYNENLYPIKDEDAVVILTSGSSGKPKSVVHTFNSLFNAAKRGNKELRAGSDDKWLLSLPLYHISGFSIFLRALAGQIPLVLNLSNNTTTKKFYNAAERNPTLVSFVTTQLKEFIDNPDASNYKFRSILGGGGAIDEKLLLKSGSLELPLLYGYGSSESSAFIALTDSRSAGSGVLKPLEGVVVENVSNELTVSTDQLFDRYLDDIGLTSEKKKNGRFFTGDEATIFPDGSFKITGRANRFIISGGINVDPGEVESAIKEYHGVIEVFVFSVTNEKWGEAVSALLKTEDDFDIMDYHKYLRTKLTPHKIPKYYRIVDDIPKSAIGKYDPLRAREILFER